MRNRKFIPITLAILLLLVIAAGFVFRPGPKPKAVNPVSQPEGTVVAEVKMTDDGFEPAKVTIKDGQAVRFINVSQNRQHWPASNIHPTHDLYPEFDVKRGMAPGEQWVFTFRKQGIWPMHDHLYPYIKGTVTVE